MPRPKDILTVRVQGHRTFTKGEHGEPGSLIDYLVQVDDIDCVTGETCNPLIPLTDRETLFAASAQGLLHDAQRHHLGSIAAAEEFFERVDLQEEKQASHDKRRECGKKGKEPKRAAYDKYTERCLDVLQDIGFPQRDLSKTAMAKWYLEQTKPWNDHMLEGDKRPSVQTLRKTLIPEFIRRDEERCRRESEHF